ncbi:MAG TPA: hypothetical protein VMT36_02715 [Candidatus Saccharimonadia bacterium]|nr:hypothetical protein [Candidatus Saccharimonadia bacterium]
MRRTLIVLLLACLLLVVGCQPAEPDISGRPTEADAPVINVFRFKKDDQVDTRRATMPLGTLYGDGRVIRPAPQPATEPGPALPSLQVTTLDSAGVDAVLKQAADTGLVGADREFRMPTEQDPTITAFEVFLNGQRRATIVESLAEIADDDPRLPPQGLAERKGMKMIVAMLTDPKASLSANIVGEDTVYAPTAVRVLIAPGTSLEPSSAEPTKLDWPLADLATAGEPVKGAEGVSCVVVDGDDWTKLEPVAASANQLTRWSSGGAEYALRFRPLLPGEGGC